MLSTTLLTSAPLLFGAVVILAVAVFSLINYACGRLTWLLVRKCWPLLLVLCINALLVAWLAPDLVSLAAEKLSAELLPPEEKEPEDKDWALKEYVRETFGLDLTA